ncbi:MAG: YdeI/OmpD-associated family protein [Flavobacteriales bacterium]
MMPKVNSFEEYVELEETFQDELNWLRDILTSTELEETIKWYIPTYCINNKNVIGLIRLKDGVGIWFNQGVFLSDRYDLLINAQEGKTKGMRSLRISKVNEVSEEVLREYIAEAIENQKAGMEVKIERGKVIEIPELLMKELKNKNILHLFEKFSQGKQNEFSEYISGAKQEKTKMSRIEKIIPMIEEGIGLNDKYRK